MTHTVHHDAQPAHERPYPPSFGAAGTGQSTDRYGRTVQVFNLRYLPGWLRSRDADSGLEEPARDRAGGLLLGLASVLLLLLAVAQGYVSFRAQYAFVHVEKGEHTASMLEALGLDCAAVIFALLALAQARLGRPAVAERALNLACVAGSLAMNALSADASSVKSVAAWILPAALYAAASDRLIAVVRRRALADRADADGSPLAAARGLALWGLRMVMAPATTVKGFRSWVLEEAPVAPGRRALPSRRDLPALPAPGPDPKVVAVTAANGTQAGELSASRPSGPPRDGQANGQQSATRTAPTTGARSATRASRQAVRLAGKARALLTANPEMTGAELGRRLKVSERTGSRLRARITTENTATETNTPANAEGDAA